MEQDNKSTLQQSTKPVKSRVKNSPVEDTLQVDVDSINTEPVVSTPSGETYVEAFYYNHCRQSEKRNTFDVYVQLKNGNVKCIRENLSISEARTAVYSINRELGHNRVERIYTIKKKF